MGAESESASSLWEPFEGGRTLGERGSEGGIILCDEEHVAGARITLEQPGVCGPFAITCGIYGLFVHTTQAEDEAAAFSKYEAMKQRLDEIIALPDLDISSQLWAFADAFQ